MSIKNIIQQENDLQEMSQQSLANYLNNPTGQYNPYLVAGELQRKEAFAQRQMTEAPQETVVDELVAQAIPMGGMPRGGMPMPQPRPEEVMVSDTITETGIANLPAPNIGQNYAGGGIVEYDNGGEVGLFDKIKDFGRERLSGLEAGLDERTARSLERMRIYEETGEFPEMTEQDLDDALAVGGLGAIGSVGGKVMPYIKDTTKKAADYIKNKLKPKPEKPLTKKQKADAKAKKIKDDKAKAKADKANEFKKVPKPGAVDRAIGRGLLKTADLAATGIAYPLAGAVRNPMTGIGALGLGAYFKNQYDKSQEEAARLKEEETKKAAAALTKKEIDKLEEQKRADALQAKRQEEADRRAYLALALGGAKTMAGQSPYALANIGEGLGTGVASLVELEEAETARQAATDIAEQKFMNDLYKQSINQMNEFAELKLKLRGGEDPTFTNRFLGRLENRGIDPSDVTNPDYIAIENETIIEMYPSMAPRGNAIVNGQAFTGV